MNSLSKGSVTIAKPVLALAKQIVENFPGPLHLLVGVTVLPIQTKSRIAIDMILVTDKALFVAIDASAKRRQAVTPSAAAQVLAGQLQHMWMGSQRLPIYAFWVDPVAVNQRADDSPLCRNAAEVQQFVLQATLNSVAFPAHQLIALVESLRRQDMEMQARQFAPLKRKQQLGQALRHWIELPGMLEQRLQAYVQRLLHLGQAGPLLPADVGRQLAKAMLARDRMIEDADYKKIVPNEYIVELNQDNYARHYQPIEGELRQRWQAKLMEVLDTANQRLGRQVYKLGGPLRVQVRPESTLTTGAVRILAQIKPATDFTAILPPAACLALVPPGRRWSLRPGTTIIGRDPQCDIYLDLPAIQQTRLISGRHATIVSRDGKYHLVDGDGDPSTNGTFVNGQRVGLQGRVLYDGDLLTLGARHPTSPETETFGGVCLRFQLNGDQAQAIEATVKKATG